MRVKGELAGNYRCFSGLGGQSSCMVDSCAGPELPDCKLWRLLGLRVSMSAERGCACPSMGDVAVGKQLTQQAGGLLKLSA